MPEMGSAHPAPPQGAPGGDVVLNPPPGFPGGGSGLQVPTRGAFALSETVPLLREWADRMHEARTAWERARVEANEKKAHAKKVRADLLVTLRVFGNEQTGGIPMKTAVERNEWADADANVQRAELEADLAQTLQMSAREAYEETARVFDTFRSMLAVERDDMKREHSTPHEGQRGYGR